MLALVLTSWVCVCCVCCVRSLPGSVAERQLLESFSHMLPELRTLHASLHAMPYQRIDPTSVLLVCTQCASRQPATSCPRFRTRCRPTTASTMPSTMHLPQRRRPRRRQGCSAGQAGCCNRRIQSLCPRCRTRRNREAFGTAGPQPSRLTTILSILLTTMVVRTWI